MKRPISLTLTSFLILNYSSATLAYDATSPLTKVEQSSANRGNSYARSGKGEKAQTAYQTAIDQAVSIEQCVALIKSTEHYGSILSPVRRNILTKALSLAKNNDDYFQIIIAARQCQFYEVTKQCIDALIARAKTKDELLDLAHKAQSTAINDVAHIAMEKLYAMTASQDRLVFAKQAKLMAMEDLMRNAVKDMLDEEQTAHGLCLMLKAIEPLELPDLERKILRKAVYQVASVDDCKEVYEAGRRYNQQDIVNLAAFKGRKMMLIEQAQSEQEAIKEQQELKEAEANGESPPPRTTQTHSKQDNKPAPPVPGF